MHGDFMTKTVLCYLEQEKKILMLYRNKKKNDMNQGKWIGIGGHVEDNETIEQALVREVLEETGFHLLEYDFRGIVDFYNQNIFLEQMYIFTSSKFSGEMISCDEGELQWIEVEQINSLSLWEGDMQFLPLLFEESSYFEIELYYNQDQLIRSVRRK